MTLLIETITTVLTDGKGEDIVVLNTEQQSGGEFTHIVVATAQSGRHAAALAARILKEGKAAGLKRNKIEASEEREWVLIDCGDTIVHIMQIEARGRYRLEDLWSFERSTD